MTPHGFRAMARTILDEVLGFRPDFIEHQLATPGDLVEVVADARDLPGALVLDLGCRGLGAPPGHKNGRASPADAAEAAGEGFGCDPSR